MKKRVAVVKKNGTPKSGGLRAEEMNAETRASIHAPEIVALASLTPHPRNYKTHPEEQLRHIGESLKANGYYKNIVIAKDGTILAGHGVAAAAKLVGLTHAPVVRTKLAPKDPRALKIVAADNELGRFAEADDRALSEILREIHLAEDVGLLGTGYDEKMLANLVMVTRPASEIGTIDEAAEWIGMPEYEPGEPPIKLIIIFKNEADRKAFIDQQKMKIGKIAGLTMSTRWPWTEEEDPQALRFTKAEASSAS